MEKQVNLKFEHLFSPITLRGKTYRNRITAGPTMFAHAVYLDEIREGIYRMCERRAAGGAAQVSTGEVCVNFEEGICSFVNRPKAFVPKGRIDYHDRSGEDYLLFKEYADRIKRHGAIALLEFCHELSYANVEEPYRRWGPDAFTRSDGVQVHALNESMMQKICDDFAVAAEFAKACGFDGMLLHGGHGFLFQQFISPLTNHRTDEYGGCMENRARFPLRVLDSVRQAGGEDFIIELRLSAEDGEQGGMTIDDTVEFCKIIDGKCDIIHVSNGTKLQGNSSHTFTDHYDPHGYNVPFARRIKEAVSMSKVSVIGGINSPEQAEEIISSGAADFIVYGRQGFADPEFPNKAFRGDERLIRRCVRCFQCYPGSSECADDPMKSYTPREFGEKMSPARMGRCAINPEADFTFFPESFGVPSGSRRVLVVGGGAAGMQAAITAARRGHQVTLCERTDSLGGLLKFTDRDEDKADLRAFRDLLKLEVAEAGIDVRLNTLADAELIGRLAPEHIILAVGSSPKVVPIPGIEHAVSALDTYFEAELGHKVVLVGGGLVGCETALMLAGRGHDVTVVEAQGRIAPEAIGLYRTALKRQLELRNVKILTDTACSRIERNGVRIKDVSGEGCFLEADSVVYSLGMVSESVEELKHAAGDIPTDVVGDCAHVGKVGDAVASAYRAAMSIL